MKNSFFIYLVMLMLFRGGSNATINKKQFLDQEMDDPTLTLQIMSEEEYKRKMGQLYKSFRNQMSNLLSTSGVYQFFSQLSDAQFEEFMDIGMSDLVMAAENYGASTLDFTNGKSFYKKLTFGGTYLTNFNEYNQSAIDNLKIIVIGTPDQYSDQRKAQVIREAKRVMDRLDTYLSDFKSRFPNLKTSMSDYGFSSSDRELLEEYYRNYAN